MKLDKLVLVNWGSLRPQEYDMGNMTLLTGPTGSGKSTMLDALQTVMTAVYQNIFSYNPGQDETNQSSRNGKTKRTLWSYIVGAEDNFFARPDGANGYIAAVFKPSEGEEGHPFTALVAAAARVDGSGGRRQAVQERLVLLIIDDASLGLEDFIDVQSDELRVYPVEKIDTLLNLKYRGHVHNYRDTKREYLCQLYGRFLGKKNGISFGDAEQAAKAWTQAIAHKPIGSIDELVKTQILDHDPQHLFQRITQISGMMRQISGLRADGERLKANIGRLELIAHSTDQSTHSYQSALQHQLLSSKRAMRDDEHKQEEAEAAIKELGERIEGESRRTESLKEENKARQKSRVQVEARLSGIPAAEQKNQAEARLGQASKLAKNALATLISSIGHADLMQTIARQLVGKEYPSNLRLVENATQFVAQALFNCASLGYSVNSDVLKRLQEASELDTREAIGLCRTFEGADAKFEALHTALAGMDSASFVSALHTQIGGVNSAIAGASKREAEVAARKSNLAQGGADYPNDIRYALKLLRSDLAGARPQVLCDLIEPANSGWQPAIEGYMGGARFNFVVDQDWESRSINFLREKNLRGNIIQGSLCLKHAKEELLSSESVIHELATEHPIARAYLVEQFGTVVKVPDAETLRHTPRGLTKDGKGSGGRTMFTTDVRELVFGKEAKRLARERAEKEHAEAEAELVTLKGQLSTLQSLLGIVGRVQMPTFTAAAEELESSAREIELAKDDLSRLDLTEVKELQAQSESLALEINTIDKQIEDINKRVGGYEQNIVQHNDELTKLKALHDAKQAKVRDDTIRLQNLAMVNGSLSFTGLEAEVDALLLAASPTNSEIQARIYKGMQDALSHLGDMRTHLADYNTHARNEERFDAHFGAEVRNEDFGPIYAQLVVLQEKVRDQLVSQREIGMVKNVEQLRTSESSFKDVFTKQFCFEIRNLVDGGIKTLRMLNQELSQLEFGDDKFRIDWSEWVPEYKEYYDFFTAAYDMSDSNESANLFGKDELSPENCRVRDSLVALLLSDDHERAQKELQRISDYRNFRRYEIWKESKGGAKVALSEWGTGSGGQLETPAYIIRAAVVTNRLKHFDKGMNLKMMVNDESFSKMDERRAHDVISFIRDSLGMQLICAMPTKHAGGLKSEFTKEWSFTRTDAESNGEVVFVSEADERDLNPDALRTLWDARREQVRLQAQIEFEEDELKRA